MRQPGSGLLWGLGLVAAALFFLGLGAAPFLDPPEGLHAEIAREMGIGGDWVTPHFNGVRYFDKPPLLYWLMALGFSLVGPSEWAARFWSALAAFGTVLLTARLGSILGSPGAGLISGLVVGANIEFFLFGRVVKPDAMFVFFILLAYTGFILAYRGARRWALLIGYGGLGLAVLTKDLLGAAGPVLVVALFFLLTREWSPRARWLPWAGVALFVLIALPWYLAMEWKNHGFLWYVIVDNHLLNFARQRLYPDEDIPLTAAEFLGVTAIGFFPWSLMLPWAFARAFRRPWASFEARGWLLLGLWAGVVLAFFTISPFRLPHYALPAFPAMALLVGKLWDDVLGRSPGAPSFRTLLVPPLVVLVGLAVLFTLGWRGELSLPSGALALADLPARNLEARGQVAPFAPLAQIQPLLGTAALIFGAGSLGLAVAVWRGLPRFGLGVLMATMLAFLPVTVEGLALVSRSRSVKPMAEVLRLKAGPEDLLVHEGALENSGSLFLSLRLPMKVVDGLQSNLAFGATFPEAREVFLSRAELRGSWDGQGRVFLLSVVRPEKSVVREFPPASVNLMGRSGGRWLYSNRP